MYLYHTEKSRNVELQEVFAWKQYPECVMKLPNMPTSRALLDIESPTSF